MHFANFLFLTFIIIDESVILPHMNLIKFTCRQAEAILPYTFRNYQSPVFYDAAAVTCCFNHAYNLTLVVILHRYRRLTKRPSRLAYDFFSL